ncbi:MAG: hypothetical protein WC270_02585 [Patescibacteria group bacterium]
MYRTRVASITLVLLSVMTFYGCSIFQSDPIWRSNDGQVSLNIDSLVTAGMISEQHLAKGLPTADGIFDQYSVVLPLDRDGNLKLSMEDVALIDRVKEAYEIQAKTMRIYNWQTWRNQNGTILGVSYFVGSRI